MNGYIYLTAWLENKRMNIRPGTDGEPVAAAFGGHVRVIGKRQEETVNSDGELRP